MKPTRRQVSSGGALRALAYSTEFVTRSHVRSVENLWGGIEGEAGTALRRLRAGELLNDADARAIRDLLAVHWVRSLAIRDMAEHLRDESETLRRLQDPPPWFLRGYFHDMTGLIAAGSGALHFARDEIAAHIRRSFKSAFADNLPTLLDSARELFQQSTLCRANCDGDLPLLVSDSPMVAFETARGRLEQRPPAFMGGADGVLMPLGPNTVVILFWPTSAVPQSILDGTARVPHHTLNAMQNKQARRYVYCHLDSPFAKWVVANCEPARDRSGSLVAVL